MTVSELGKRAKSTQSFLSMATTDDKNKALRAIAISLIENQDKIIAANKTDLENGKVSGLSSGMLDRLMLNSERIDGIAQGVLQVAKLEDECGKTIYEYKKDNGPCRLA